MMTTLIATRPADAAASTSGDAADGFTLSDAVAAASDAVACLPLTDLRWEQVGARLTAVVDAVRRAYGLAGSPIGSHETVAPVLRLRDLGRLAQAITPHAVADVVAPELVQELLWSLQVAAA